MHVADSTLERALLKIYQAHGLRAGGRLSIASLQRAWNRTGLRNNDFRDAVRILLGRGYLEVHDRADAMDVALTASGEARMHADGFRNPVDEAELEDVRTLDTLRERVFARSRGWDGRRRRSDDEPPERAAVTH